MAQKTLHPTLSQVDAAKLLVEMLEEDGEPVDEKLRTLAETTFDGDGSDSAGTTGVPVGVVESKLAGRVGSGQTFREHMGLLAFGPLTDGVTVQPWATLIGGVEPLLRSGIDTTRYTSVNDNQLLLLTNDLTQGEHSALVTNELRDALLGKVSPERLSAEAQRHLLIEEVDGHQVIVGVYFATAAGQPVPWWVRGPQESGAP